jgi:hypothetical protein
LQKDIDKLPDEVEREARKAAREAEEIG